MLAAVMLWPSFVCAAAVMLMVRARDFKFGVRACEICGERDEHLVGCPGRRGY